VSRGVRRNALVNASERHNNNSGVTQQIYFGTKGIPLWYNGTVTFSTRQ
jgi:hypothetical protein